MLATSCSAEALTLTFCSEAETRGETKAVPPTTVSPSGPSPHQSATSRAEGQLTNERHAGVGRPQLVGGDACVVPVAVLCHVGHCEQWSGVEVLDVHALAPHNPAEWKQSELSLCVTENWGGSAWVKDDTNVCYPLVDLQIVCHFIGLFNRAIYPLVRRGRLGETLWRTERRERWPRGEPAGCHLTCCSPHCCRWLRQILSRLCWIGQTFYCLFWWWWWSSASCRD